MQKVLGAKFSKMRITGYAKIGEFRCPKLYFEMASTSIETKMENLSDAKRNIPIL